MEKQYICLPVASAAQYRAYVDDPAQYRQSLSQRWCQQPALFPQAMRDQGYTLHDAYLSIQQDLLVRRRKVTATGAVFTLRPSFVMPYMIARTEEVEKALSLRQWGVPTGYGECAQEAQALAPTYQPRSVCTDGWHATREAWRRLLPTITLGLGVLHSVLQSQDRCRGAVRHEGVAQAWGVYQATTKRQVAQRLRRLAEWTPAHRSGAVAAMVLKMCRRRADFTPA